MNGEPPLSITQYRYDSHGGSLNPCRLKDPVYKKYSQKLYLKPELNGELITLFSGALLLLILLQISSKILLIKLVIPPRRMVIKILYTQLLEAILDSLYKLEFLQVSL